MEKTFNIMFNNRISYSELNKLPKTSGIYLIRKTIKKDNTLASTILYIGESTNLYERLNNSHEELSKAMQMIRYTNYFITISYAELDEETNKFRVRIEQCLIYNRKPPLNDIGKYNFNHHKTIVNIGGNFFANLKKKYIAENR